MIIDLSSIDREQFDVSEHVIAGEPCYLVQPQRISVNWTPETLIYRSSLWNARGEPISLSWRKAFNWDERPDIDPAPRDLSGVELMEKVDGSTLLVSRYKDEVVVRTRGTVDATKMANGDEIALFKERYPKLFNLRYSGPISGPPNAFTAVCEWVSPRNQIVIPYPEPDLYLTGIITHDDYSYVSQDILDSIAKDLGIKRPRRYSFNTIPEMLAAVTEFKGVEGVCVYYNGGNTYRKHKASVYLVLHRFKENVTLSNMLDLFFSYSRPDAPAFLDRIAHEFDYECRNMANDLAWTICAAYAKVVSRYNLMEVTVSPLRALPRRDAAMTIMATYQDHWKGAAFNLLDNKPLDDKTVRRLMEAALEEST